MKLDKDLLKRLVNQEIINTRDYYAGWHIQGDGYPGSLESTLEALDTMIKDVRNILDRGAHHIWLRPTRHLMDEEQDLELDEEQARLLAFHLTHAHIQGIEEAKAVITGGKLFRAHPIYSEPQERPLGTPAEPIKVLDSLSLSELIDRYDKEHEAWIESTRNANLSSPKLLIEVVGDIPANSINREVMKRFRDVCRCLPKNMRKKVQYREKTIPELLEMNIPEKDRLSIPTINQHLQRVGTMLKEGMAIHGVKIEGDPLYNLYLTDDRKASDKRAAYTLDELNRLFGSEEYREDSFKGGYQFWSLPIALFHGMRRREIAQLYLDDIRLVPAEDGSTDNGVWVFDINKATKDKSLKNLNSVRLVPIHPYLIEELRFLEFVNRLREVGHERLFPGLSWHLKEGYGRKLGHWYNAKYKRKCGITTEDGKMRDLHSFRANWYTRAVELGVNWLIQKDVVGHSSNDDMADIYLKTASPRKSLDEVISKIDFHELIDLSHLKTSRFVTGRE